MKCWGSTWMVHVEPVGDAGQAEHLVGGPAAELLTHRLDQEEVRVEREMGPVLLGRAGGEEDDLPELDRVVHLGPGELVVLVDLARLHRTS